MRTHGERADVHEPRPHGATRRLEPQPRGAEGDEAGANGRRCGAQGGAGGGAGARHRGAGLARARGPASSGCDGRPSSAAAGRGAPEGPGGEPGPRGGCGHRVRSQRPRGRARAMTTR